MGKEVPPAELPLAGVSTSTHRGSTSTPRGGVSGTCSGGLPLACCLVPTLVGSQGQLTLGKWQPALFATASACSCCGAPPLSSGVPDLAVADRWNCPCVMTMPRSASRLVQPHEPVRGDLPLSSNHHHRSARTSRILESPLSSPRIFACAKVSAASWMRSRTTRQAPQLACQNSHQNRQAPAWINFSQ